MAAPTQIGTLPTGPTGPTGPAGADGTNGTNGTNAINSTTTTASFTMPAAGTGVSVAMTSVAFMSVGLYLFIATAGNGKITAISSLNVTWVPDASGGNATSGTISSGVGVYLSARRGSRIVGTYSPGALPSSDGVAIAVGDIVFDTAGAYYQYLT